MPMNVNPKCLVIGLDGVSQTLLTDYIGKGYLPNLKEILSRDYRLHQMDASIPDVSSTSWTSFMTGVNPGEHGIFGFMDLAPNSYKMFFPNSRDVKGPAVWDMLGGTVNGRTSTLYESYRDKLNKPLRSIVMNIPQTYPALALNGILTAGFVCPDLKKGTYPDTAYNYLNSIGYLSDVDSSKAVNHRDAFFEEIFLALEKRAQAYEYFLKNESWDMFIGVITETDRLHHFFFDAARDSKNSNQEVFISFYKAMDEIIGRLFNLFMEQTNGKGLFITMSDHGFTELKQEVYINSFLKDKGFLRINNQKEYFEQVDSGTRAFAMEPARIYINMEGKYPKGSVKQLEKEQMAKELKEVFESLVDSEGKSVIKAVYANSELYKGPLSDKGPDLVCVANDGYDLKSTFKKDGVFGKGVFRGMHTQYDAHCILPNDIEIKQRLHIEDMAGIILDYFVKSDR